MPRIALALLGARIPIGLVEVAPGRFMKVYPSRELLQFLDQLHRRVGGDSPDVDLTPIFPEVYAPTGSDGASVAEIDSAEMLMVVSGVQLQDMIREAVAIEMCKPPIAAPAAPDMSIVAPSIAADSPLVYEMTMGVASDG